MGSTGRWWVPREQYPKDPDVIVAIGYATLRSGLAHATEASVRTAERLALQYPRALIAYADAAHSFPGSDAFEAACKQKLLSNIAPERIIDAGGIVNSVTEAEVINQRLVHRGIYPREILLVCEALHAWSVRWIWQRTFPQARLTFKYIDVPAYQPDAPFFLQRGPVRWFLANVLRQLALCILGIDFVRGVQHPK